MEHNRYLKILCLIASIVTIAIWIAFFIPFFINIEKHFYDYFLDSPGIVLYPLFCVFTILIVLKSNSNKGALYFSLFLSLLSQNYALQVLFIQFQYNSIDIIITTSFLITSLAYIKSFQYFPQEISVIDIDAHFSKMKIIGTYLKEWLKVRMIYVFFIIIYLLSVIFPNNLIMQASAASFVLLTGLLFLFINYKISTPSSRNKIRWLFWGILCYTFLTIFNSIITNSSSEIHEFVIILFKVLRALSLFISITMSLFFFDTFDTGILIRRTIVDGILFIAIVFLYNIIEHYLLHLITHKLHVSDTLISSILSGFFVLIFSPVHHKFMHVLDKRFKR